MGICLIPNCRKQTPSSEPFCVDHRDPPTWEQKYNAAMHNWSIDSKAKDAEIAALQSKLSAYRTLLERLVKWEANYEREAGHFGEIWPIVEDAEEALK